VSESLFDGLRRFRQEFWLWVATVATGRALDACKAPEDEETVRKILESTRIWL
jgi:hypothetical protein